MFSNTEKCDSRSQSAVFYTHTDKISWFARQCTMLNIYIFKKKQCYYFYYCTIIYFLCANMLWTTFVDTKILTLLRFSVYLLGRTSIYRIFFWQYNFENNECEVIGWSFKISAYNFVLSAGTKK